MVKIETFRKTALSFEGASEVPHFERIAFRSIKKIFATLDEVNNRVMLVLPLIEQSVYIDTDPLNVYPVPGKWGKKGCTYLDLSKVKSKMLMEATKLAYETSFIKTKK